MRPILTVRWSPHVGVAFQRRPAAHNNLHLGAQWSEAFDALLTRSQLSSLLIRRQCPHPEPLTVGSVNWQPDFASGAELVS
jgi:hypothetical protein